MTHHAPGITSLADVAQLENQQPFSKLGLPASTYEALKRGAEINPELTALTFFFDGNHYQQAIRLSFRQLMAKITQAANMFHQLGNGEDIVVSMLLPNLPECHFTIWGAETAGIVNPINPMLEGTVIADIMRAAGTTHLVTLAPMPGADLWEKVDAFRRSVPSLKTILRVDPSVYMGRSESPAEINNGQRILDFHNTLEQHSSDSLQFQREIMADTIASYFHTGGTTGTPKLARHSHFNEVADAHMSAEILGVRKEQVFFCGLPLFHVNGVIVTGLIPWSRGASVILGTPQGYRNPGVLPNFWKIVEHYRVNFFSGVPTIYSSLLQVPIGKADVSCLNYAICGAAPMPVEVFTEFERRTGLRILEGYGLTEGTCVSSVNPPEGERRVGSVGIRLPYQQMRSIIVDGEGHYLRDAEVDEIGLIVIRGPNVFQGYKEEVHNKGLWIHSKDGGAAWMNTGDLGRQDAQGYFWLTGRRKELIIRGGHNIDPKVIEDPLHLHPDVKLVAAVGRPDPYAGELPVAYVQLQEGANTSVDELLAFASEHVGERAAVPKIIRIVNEIPLTAVGKIFKPQLAWREIEDVYQAEVSTLEGVKSVEVHVAQSKTHGRAAIVRVSAQAGQDLETLRERIDEVLGRYTVPYEITFSA